jgi:hypothetical protein
MYKSKLADGLKQKYLTGNVRPILYIIIGGLTLRLITAIIGLYYLASNPIVAYGIHTVK